MSIIIKCQDLTQANRNKMFKLPKRRICFAFVIGLLILTSCISVTTFQSPKVLLPKEKAFGIGIGGYLGHPYEYIKPLHIDIFARFGLVKNLDAGIKLFSFGSFCDVKYQITQYPLLVSVDMGISYVYGEGILEGHSSSVLGLYPMLLLGKGNYYGGIKYIYVRDASFDYQHQYIGTDIFTFPVILAGASFGRKFRIIPELSLYYNAKNRETWKILPIGGIGLQYVF